jgi:anti-sigma B factor antagonist
MGPTDDAGREGAAHVQMTVDEQIDGDRAVLTVHGEVDVYTAPTLREHVLTAVGDGASTLVVDLSDVAFMDSTGLGVLVGALKRLRQADGRLVVVCTSEPVLKILTVTGLLDVFGVVGSLDEVSDLS